MLSATLIPNTTPNMGKLWLSSNGVQGGVSEYNGFGGNTWGYYQKGNFQFIEIIDFRTQFQSIMKMQDAGL